MHDNISAIATPLGTGGVAIVRISGDSPLIIAEKMFKPTKKIEVKNFAPYTLYTGEIECKGFKDFGLCVYFKAPSSFTGEDVVEFHCHGGFAITMGVLKRTIELGARPAAAGEFTKRAFINGKLSLSAAEGLIDMINSQSQAEVRAGYNLYREKLKTATALMQQELTQILAEIDAGIDFPEDDIPDIKQREILSGIEKISVKLGSISETYAIGSRIKNGVTVAIVGRPNTGKSSILNAILGSDRAIVSDIAGTTRDIVEGIVEINGVKFNLYDTAGIRQSVDTVEKLGIERSKKMIDNADIVLFVLDASEPLTEEDFAVKDSLSDKNILVVYNKIDKKEKIKTGGIDILVSAKTGLNIDKLKMLMFEKTVGKVDVSGEYLMVERHYRAIESAKKHLDNAAENFDSFPLDALTVDIKAAWEKLGEISGQTANEDIINEIFMSFCVGK